MLTILVISSTLLASHVRSMDAVIGRALADGVERSAVIRRLVNTIDASDVMVYLDRGECPSPAVSCLMMGASTGGVRYVRINFKIEIGLGMRANWHPDELSIMMAHELQHAAEIAQWSDVVDNATLMAAYTRRGLALGYSRYETMAARHAGDERRLELRQRHR